LVSQKAAQPVGFLSPNALVRPADGDRIDDLRNPVLGIHILGDPGIADDSSNPLPAAPGMVLFLHAILIDAARNLAMSLGHTILITPTGAEVLSRIEPAYTVAM
jgi:hypothetical protein